MNIANIKDFGAQNDDATNNAILIQKAIDHCANLGGGKVVIPAGKPYLSGPFSLKSNIELHLEQGAVLKAFPDESIYTKSAFRQNPGEGTVWIEGENLNQISITGGGTLDGNGIFFMGEELHDSYELKPFDVIDPRPHMLTLVSCKNIKIYGVTVSNAAYWALHFIGCYDVSIENISLYNNLKIRNSDGIDLDHCQNVRISNCHIESGERGKPEIQKLLTQKGIKVDVRDFYCRGEFLVLHKGKPDSKDIADAKKFARKMMGE